MPNLLGRTTEVDIQLKETLLLNKNLEKQLERTRHELRFLGFRDFRVSVPVT